jgi:DNA-binding beta-propeller fold protein YncE
LEKARFAHSLLAAPGKVAVSPESDRVAVSDTLHHRIILAQPDGKILHTIGTGKAGMRDGRSGEAQFRAPQGLVFGDGILLVADTGNHAIRLIELNTGKVTTLAGTGRIGTLRRGEYDARQLDLRSPWDLALKDGEVYIAMAGNHQIWRLSLGDGRIRPYAGSRREGIDTGSLDRASFSQPSGLALTGTDLFVADAEASAIRRIRMDFGQVENLVGKGLFEFGDRDGGLDEAQLQHATGVALLDRDRLVIADTYNHKVKLLDRAAGEVTTLLGSGRPGRRLGTAADTELNEPGGVAAIGGRLLIADTNNHRILEFSPQSGKVRAWPLRE